MRTARSNPAKASRGRILGTGIGGIVLAAALLGFSPSSSLSAERVPPWMEAADLEMGMTDFPEDELVELYRFRSVRVDASGKREVTERHVYHVRQGKAPEHQAYSFPESDWHRLRELRAWRRSRQGQVEFRKDVAMTQGAGGELYAEDRTLIVTLSDVDPGDVLGFEARWEEDLTEARADWMPARTRLAVLRGEYMMSLPDGWIGEALWIEPAVGRTSALAPLLSADRALRWSWNTLSGSEEAEPYEPPDEKLIPSIVVRYADPSAPAAGMARWRDVALWFGAYSVSSLDAGDELRAVARDLVMGTSEPMERAARIAEFVRSSIRYVQIYLGDGGWRPHRVDRVYQSRYGDCKDMAHLTVALLTTIGVQAWPVLTNARARDAWPNVPMPSFDHCIVALAGPDGGLRFFDPTAKEIPFGSLPFALEGKGALVVGHGGDSTLVRLPRSGAEQNYREYRAAVELAPDLSAVARVVELRTGHPAHLLRGALKDETPGSQRRRWERSLTSAFPGSRLRDWTCSELGQVQDTLRVDYTADIPGFGRAVGNSVIVGPDFLTARSKSLFGTGERRMPVELSYPYRTDTMIQLNLPEGWAMEEAPHDTLLHNRFASYAMAIADSGRAIRVDRSEEVRLAELPVEQFELAREWDRTCCQSDRQRLILARP